MLELQITTDLEALPHELSFNFDELKVELTAQLERYKGLVITEEAIKEGKEDRAKLNKLKTAIDTRRKEIKKQWAEPYMVFENKIKEIMALIDQPIAEIDSQLNAYETKRKEERQTQIREIYLLAVPDELKQLLPLERIFDQRWLNKGTNLDTIDEEISKIVERTNNELAALRAIEPENAAAVRAKYAETLDLGKALQYRKTLQEAAAALKREEPTNNPPAAPEPAVAPQQPAVDAMAQQQPKASDEKLYALRLEFHLTKQQANDLKRFLADNNINYTKI